MYYKVCITCGQCDFCKREQFSACSTANPSHLAEPLMGDKPMAAYGYSHLTGAVPGGQAEFVRVAYADWLVVTETNNSQHIFFCRNCLPIPDDVPDEKALYLTDIIPTGLHGARLGEVWRDYANLIPIHLGA